MSKINSISALWEFQIVCWDKDGGIRERDGLEICNKIKYRPNNGDIFI